MAIVGGSDDRMGVHGSTVTIGTSAEAAVLAQATEEATDRLRRGPWTEDEDLLLIGYINNHGDGRWNSLARCAGLKRTGKSCRLRWLNYLRPHVRRGNITPEEQLLILELHMRWGNRWSKIAQHLPGRTDNEIKNYWRTRVQKHAKQLQCDVNSKRFKDVVRYLWIPRLVERIRAAAASTGATVQPPAPSTPDACAAQQEPAESMQRPCRPVAGFTHSILGPAAGHSRMAGSSTELSEGTHTPSSPVSGGNGVYGDEFSMGQICGGGVCSSPDSLLSPCGYFNQGFPVFEPAAWSDNFWDSDDLSWFLQQQQ